MTNLWDYSLTEPIIPSVPLLQISLLWISNTGGQMTHAVWSHHATVGPFRQPLQSNSLISVTYSLITAMRPCKRSTHMNKRFSVLRIFH